MARLVHVKGYTRKAPTSKSKAAKKTTSRSVKPSKPGTRYGSLPHQRLPRRGEL